MKGDQFKEEYLAINPNNKIPTIVDGENGRSIFESGAILLYLAEKTGRLIGKNSDERWEVIQWTIFQV